MSDRNNRFALINKFEKTLKIHGIASQPMNKYNEQWAADALLQSFTLDEIYEAMEYYFKINPRPTWKGFANNVDKLIQSKKDRDEDDRLRAERRAMAKEWLNG